MTTHANQSGPTTAADTPASSQQPTQDALAARAEQPAGTVHKLPEMAALGFNFDRWQQPVEAAIATDHLQVTGEVRGGQLIQFTDPSGAQLNILAVEPFATFVGFNAVTQSFAHVDMVNDVLAHLEVIDPFGTVLATVTANLAQGPLLAEEETQQWQQVSLTALALETRRYASAEAFEAETGQFPAVAKSSGAEIIASGSGVQAPTPAFEFAGRVMESQWLTNELTGQRFAHVVLDGAFPLDVCLPDDGCELPEKNTVLAGSALLTASVAAPTGGCGSGGGCGCGSGGCGCS